MRLLPLLLALVTGIVMATPALAQDAWVAVDAGGEVELLDLETARAADVFVGEYPGFISAEIFQAPDGSFRLDVRRNVGGRVVVENRPISASEVESLRQRVTLALAERPTVRGGTEGSNARLGLLAGSTALGVALYGWAIPSGLGIDDSRWQTGLYMLTASGSFILPWLLTEEPVSLAATDLALNGGSRGFAHGALLYNLVAGDRERTVCEFDYCYVTDDDDARLLVGSAVGIGEAVGGYLLADRSGMEAGHANAITTGGDWGLLMGLGAAELAGANERGFGGAGLLGAGLGLGLGHYFGRDAGYSYGDVNMLSLPGWIGLYAGASLTDASGGNNDATVVAAMLGGTAGLIAGDLLVRDHDYTFTQSTLTALGTIAGGLLGLGTAVILDDSVDDFLAAGLSSAGAASGFLLTRSLLDEAAPESALRLHLTPDLLGAGPAGVRLAFQYSH